MGDTKTKYIDADRLSAEIEKHIKEVKDAAKRLTPNMGFFDAKLSGIYDVMSIVASLQQEQPELPPIGYAETYYQKGLHDGFIKGQMEILKVLDEIEKRKAEPVLVIKEHGQQGADLEKEMDKIEKIRADE